MEGLLHDEYDHVHPSLGTKACIPSPHPHTCTPSLKDPVLSSIYLDIFMYMCPTPGWDGKYWNNTYIHV